MEQQISLQNIINILTAVGLIIDITDKLTLELIIIIAISMIVIGYLILLPTLIFICIKKNHSYWRKSDDSSKH